MDTQTFERLLYEEESEVLDFKSQQYAFVKSEPDEKSELLKDILGFVNAWRRAEAYILIGVEDVRGSRAIPLGIPPADQLDDHSLQQFVNSLTNLPIHFTYKAFTFEDKHFGIIRIEQQPRPLFLKRDYGKLCKDKVYVRRGSSTDPTKPASPDEVVQMGHGSARQSAELVVEFADVNRDKSLGTSIALDAEFCDFPPKEAIPDFAFKRDHDWVLGIGLSASLIGDRPNPDYFRELADYERARRLLRPIRLSVTNVGQVAANRVRTEIIVPADIGIALFEATDIPDTPEREFDLVNRATLTKIRPAFRHDPGEVSIDRNDDRFKLEIDCGSLQPARKVWSDTFYIGRTSSGGNELIGRIFADNLPQPKEFSLGVTVTVTNTRLSVDDLIALPEPANNQW